MRPSHLGAILWCVLAACGGGDAPESALAFATRDSAEVVIAENLVDARAIPVWDLPTEPQLRLGTVDGPAEYQFFRVSGATLLEDGTLVVLNAGSSEVRVYDPDGTHRASFGSAGEGPEEFGRLWEVWPTGRDTLLIYDWRNQRLARWTIDGEFVDLRPIRPTFANAPFPAGRLADGSLVFMDTPFDPPERGFARQSMVLYRFDATGALRDTVTQVPGQLMGRMEVERTDVVFFGAPHFAPSASAVALDERIIVAPGDAYELRVLDSAGEHVGLIRWRGRDRTVTEADVDALRERQLSRAQNDEQRRRALDFFEATPAAEEFGTALNLLGGADGDIWVLELPRPRDPEGLRWMGFDRGGRLIGQLRLPPRATLRDIGRDHLILVELDELDVEHVVVYPLPWEPTESG